MLALPDTLREADTWLRSSSDTITVERFLDLTHEEADIAAMRLHEMHLQTHDVDIDEVLNLESGVSVSRLLALRQFLILRRALDRDPALAANVIFHPGDEL